MLLLGIGTYAYPAPGSARPHAATSVNGAALTYNANGNMLRGRGRTCTLAKARERFGFGLIYRINPQRMR